ncbi:transcriptional regulator [Microbacterium sp. CH12i]|uniref:PadR family transcriptional regulator n=1 Tax=Microbacterium sp. CH12i TaxID=1479651 RepID=UPI00046141EF|nr:PadR family transcriptional regulator [Microbacterium sp. CH12i]KDA04670.1 transcriptional regulator [Microbacterium sp. CH12i]
MRDLLDRLTPMGVMVLALLREGDMHPYEMARLMRARRDDRLLTITNGTLYHTVARLQKLALIDEVGTDRDGNRPERTTYTLTESGRDAVRDWVERELPRTDRPTEFRIALAESHNLELSDVIGLLHARRSALTADHEMHLADLHKTSARGVPEQFLLEIQRQETLLEAEIGWMDSLLTRLEAGAIPWGAAGFDDSDRYLAQRKAAQQ